jgi:MoaA/NifB/PqqE/SkfB family radical SAM enzyme
MVNGDFVRYGRTIREDPLYGPGPEIADIEISTTCHGINNKPCSFCYKSNTPRGENMSIETFKAVFANLPETVGQIAFGIGDIDGNPDIWKIFRHCRENKVVPNITINGARLTDHHVKMLAHFCGAVAVSRYEPDLCYNTVKRLTDAGLQQVNIHMLLSAQTYKECFKVISDAKEDPRLEKLRAIVFLAVKPQGRGKQMSPVSPGAYRELVHCAFKEQAIIGFDSCSAPLFLNAIKDHPDYKKYLELAEPCESYLFSTYVNVRGRMFPCSFLEDVWSDGIDLTSPVNFKEVWFGKEVREWREKLLATAETPDCLVKGCRQCPAYKIYGGEQ